jgi:hypothetical protein
VTRQQREDFERRVEQISNTASALFERYSPAQLTRRPAAASWSAAECVAHLNLTAARTVPLVETAVADLRDRGVRTDSPSRMDWLGQLLRWSLEPPPRFRARATAPFQPQSVEPFGDLLPDFLAWQKRAVEAARNAEGFDAGSCRITSPVSSRIRYNVLSALRIMETHERRHLWQAERAVSGAGVQQ